MRQRYLLLSFPLLALAGLPVACTEETDLAGTNDAGANGDGGGDTGAPNDAGSEASTGDASDAGVDSGDSGDAGPTFRVSGTATYDWVPANDDVTENGVLLDYEKKAARPIRRATVFAMENGSAVAQTTTNDSGAFELDVPVGSTITIRVAAATAATANVADGIAPDRCAGASWDVKVVDNTKQNAQYTLDDATPRSAAASGITLNAPLVYANNAYVTRTAAPFAIMDTIVTELELICQGKADVNLPSLIAGWSVDNVPSGNDESKGEIGTSHYERDPVSGQSALYILGKEDADTDEFDDHVIAHEFGHYLEDRLFRSDSPGGRHETNDVLDPRLAFGEGFGNALSGMTFDDPIYVDTSGPGQASGSTIPVNVAPAGDDRGIYSEASVQYMLWSLFENRPGSGSIDRIYNVFASFQTTTPGLTSLLTFSAYYNQVYGGAAESLETLWGTALATPYDALCAGACTGSGDTADVFDTDNDIGIAYAATRRYPQTTGGTFSAELWRQSRVLVDGANTTTEFDRTLFGGYAEPTNKLGAQRAYRYVSTSAQSTTISVGSLGASACTNDVLDMKVFLAGKPVAADQESAGATAGCPTATFDALANATYTVVVNGMEAEIPSYVVTVSHKPTAPFTIAARSAIGVAEETDLTIPILVTPTRDVAQMRVTVRGLDGIRVATAPKVALGARTRGASVVQPALVRVAHGGAGYVAVDVSGIVNGRRTSATYVLPVRATSAMPASHTIGALVQDTDGKRSVSMKAVLR